MSRILHDPLFVKILNILGFIKNPYENIQKIVQPWHVKHMFTRQLTFKIH